MKTLAAITPVLILLLAAAAGVLIYYLVYRRKVNKILEEGSDRDSAGPEPGNVGRSGLMIVLILIMVIMLIRIAGLKTAVKELTDTVNRQNSQLYTIQGMINDMDEAMKKENSQITEFDVAYGKMDKDDHTTELTFKVTLKKVTDSAEVAVQAGDITIPLKRNADSTLFTGTLETDIFARFDDPPVVIIKQEGGTSTEETEYYELTELWMHYLPQLITSGGGSAVYDKDRMKVEWTIGLDLFSKAEGAGFKKDNIILKTMVDGQVINTRDISSEVSWEESYGVLRMDLDESYDIKENQELSMMVSVEDTYGYIHECTVMRLTGTGEQDIVEEETGDYRIYDAGGTLIRK